jgi:hypothetical protein
MADIPQPPRVVRDNPDEIVRRGQEACADIARLIADRLLQRLSPTKVRQVLEQLPQVITERAELPREPMSAEPPKRGKKQRRTIEDFQRNIAAKHKAVEAAS